MLKPGITLLVAISSFTGYIIATRNSGTRSWIHMTASIVGVSLACIGASIGNQLYEHQRDKRMWRTMNRAITRQKLKPIEAGSIGLLCFIFGLAAMAICGQFMALWLTILAALIYLFIYTPLKRITCYSMFVGTIPGAMPPVIGYVAATHTIYIEAWILFIIMVLWQIPHFLAIGWYYRQDYMRAELRVVSNIDRDGSKTSILILLSCLLLGTVSTIPFIINVCDMMYLITALIAATTFSLCGAVFSVYRTNTWAKVIFWASIIYLPVVMGMMAIDLQPT